MVRKKITRRKVSRRKVSRKMISKRGKTNYRRNRKSNRITRKKGRKSTKRRLYKKGGTKDISIINLFRQFKKIKGRQRGGYPVEQGATAVLGAGAALLNAINDSMRISGFKFNDLIIYIIIVQAIINIVYYCIEKLVTTISPGIIKENCTLMDPGNHDFKQATADDLTGWNAGVIPTEPVKSLANNEMLELTGGFNLFRGNLQTVRELATQLVGVVPDDNDGAGYQVPAQPNHTTDVPLRDWKVNINNSIDDSYLDMDAAVAWLSQGTLPNTTAAPLPPPPFNSDALADHTEAALNITGDQAAASDKAANTTRQHAIDKYGTADGPFPGDWGATLILDVTYEGVNKDPIDPATNPLLFQVIQLKNFLNEDTNFKGKDDEVRKKKWIGMTMFVVLCNGLAKIAGDAAPTAHENAPLDLLMRQLYVNGSTRGTLSMTANNSADRHQAIVSIRDALPIFEHSITKVTELEKIALANYSNIKNRIQI